VDENFRAFEREDAPPVVSHGRGVGRRFRERRRFSGLKRGLMKAGRSDRPA